MGIAEGRACHDIERRQWCEGDSLSGECRGRSGQGKKAAEWRALTFWSWQRDGGHVKCFGVERLEIIEASES